jgi:maltoporin
VPSQGVTGPAAATPHTGFSFGSYGRVGIATDLRGRSGRQANLVAHGPRGDLPSYAELQFNYDANLAGARWRTVITLALNEQLFHFTGDFSGTIAVRNLYLEETGALASSLSLWAGSRMYRGDDAYLLNWWPLDNLNMVGGGARWEPGNRLTFALAVGMNRLDDPYQLQTIQVAPRSGFGPQSAFLLDRPRVIESLKATWFSNGRTAPEGFKASLYAELHQMASGVRQINDTGTRVELPSDSGVVVGAQFGLYRRANFLNLFVRWSQGLGAYGDLRVPATLTTARTAERAQELNIALAGNYETGPFGLMLGAYFRWFRDADPGVFSRGALMEGAVVARPILWIGQRAGIAAEASFQQLSYNALDPVTGDGALRGTAWRFGIMPFVSPAGRGSYTRPHLQLIYLATVRDEGARRLYAPDDPFSFNAVEHYLGLSTEWWFNSSYL